MWWKIYFWIYLLLTILGILSFSSKAPLGAVDAVSIIFGILLTFGLYAYVYKKEVLSRKAWTIIFLIDIFIVLESVIESLFIPEGVVEQYLPFWKSNLSYGLVDVLVGYVLSIPAFYATYKLAKG